METGLGEEGKRGGSGLPHRGAPPEPTFPCSTGGPASLGYAEAPRTPQQDPARSFPGGRFSEKTQASPGQADATFTVQRRGCQVGDVTTGRQRPWAVPAPALGPRTTTEAEPGRKSFPHTCPTTRFSSPPPSQPVVPLTPFLSPQHHQGLQLTLQSQQIFFAEGPGSSRLPLSPPSQPAAPRRGPHTLSNANLVTALLEALEWCPASLKVKPQSLRRLHTPRDPALPPLVTTAFRTAADSVPFYKWVRHAPDSAEFPPLFHLCRCGLQGGHPDLWAESCPTLQPQVEVLTSKHGLGRGYCG